jgi:RNA polymerase sigma-70 factor (ECF subfamily)
MGPLFESSSLSDAALAAAYRAGDERAATELVTRHTRAVVRFLYGAGASEDEADDLTQEAFIKAFRKLDTWRGDAAFRSWLLTIAGNLLKDEFRKRKGRRMVPLEDRELPDQADPHGELAAGEAEDRIREGIAQLPRLQREVFLLRVQQGADYAEIARALDTTPGAARVHYHHAVKRLKERVR